MRIASLITVLLSASLGVTVARGEDQQVVVKTPSATFASIDRNGDHRISKTEAGK